MEIIPLAKELISKNTPSGTRLKDVLGLTRFKYVWVRKILNMPMPIYVVIYNSRYPDIFIPISKVKKLKAFSIERFNRRGGKGYMKAFIYTQPVKIEQYNKKISSKSIFLKYDFAGEYFHKDL